MSGHSKWSTIKRKKGVADAKRGAVFTQVSKDIALSAREGGGDPEMNPALRLAIKKAKASNMPSANIERAINKGTGNLPGVKYENYVYEGYGPGGVAIMMEVMTDNKNRTVPDIRHIMSKNGGNLGESGCVNWMFEKKGTITLDKKGVDEDEVLEKSLELGVDDFTSDEILSKYNQKHQRSTRPLYYGTNLLVDLYNSEKLSAKVLRRLALRFGNNFWPVKRLIMGQLTEVQ